MRSGCRRTGCGRHEYRQFAEHRSGTQRGEDPALLEDLDTPFEDGCDAIAGITLFEESRAGCRLAHRDLSVELGQVVVDDESKRAYGPDRCYSLSRQAQSPWSRWDRPERSSGAGQVARQYAIADPCCWLVHRPGSWA